MSRNAGVLQRFVWSGDEAQQIFGPATLTAGAWEESKHLRGRNGEWVTMGEVREAVAKHVADGKTKKQAERAAAAQLGLNPGDVSKVPAGPNPDANNIGGFVSPIPLHGSEDDGYDWAEANGDSGALVSGSVDEWVHSIESVDGYRDAASAVMQGKKVKDPDAGVGAKAMLQYMESKQTQAPVLHRGMRALHVWKDGKPTNEDATPESIAAQFPVGHQYQTNLTSWSSDKQQAGFFAHEQYADGVPIEMEMESGASTVPTAPFAGEAAFQQEHIAAGSFEVTDSRVQLDGTVVIKVKQIGVFHVPD